MKYRTGMMLRVSTFLIGMVIVQALPEAAPLAMLAVYAVVGLTLKNEAR